MKKLGSFFPLIVAIASTIFGLFLGEWLQIVTVPLFVTETRAILTGIFIVSLLAIISIIAVVFFGQRTEQRELKWLQIEKCLGNPAEIEFELVTKTGKFNKRLAEHVRRVTSGDEILVLATYHPRSEQARAEDGAEYIQSLAEYSRTLLEKAKEPGITYRRIICLREGPEQGKIEPGRVRDWVITHTKEMLEIRRNKPNKVTLKKSKVVFGADLLIIKDKTAVISLDVFDPKSGQFRTDGIISFHNPPNGNIIQQLYEIFMIADSESIPVEKVPEE